MGNIDFNSAFQTLKLRSHLIFVLSLFPYFSSFDLPFPFLSVITARLLPAVFFVFSLGLSLYIYLHFHYVDCHQQNFKVMCGCSDNDIMTGYTCYDYHRDDSLILCSVYYLHQGLVMFYTDRSVIRRTAQSHLSVPFFCFFLHYLPLLSSNFVIIAHLSCSSSLLPLYISLHSVFIFVFFVLFLSCLVSVILLSHS